jgi:hypothetical protein
MRKLIDKDEALRHLHEVFGKGKQYVISEIQGTAEGRAMLACGVFQLQCELHDTLERAYQQVVQFKFRESGVEKILKGNSSKTWGGATESEELEEAEVVKQVLAEELREILTKYPWYPEAANLVAQKLRSSQEYRGINLGELIIQALLSDKALEELSDHAGASCQDLEMAEMRARPRLSPRQEEILGHIFGTPKGDYLKVKAMIERLKNSNRNTCEQEARRDLGRLRAFGVKNKPRIGYFIEPKLRFLVEDYLYFHGLCD